MCEVKMIKATDIIIKTLHEMKVREDEVKEQAKEFTGEHLNYQGELSKAWFDGALSAFSFDREILINGLDQSEIEKLKISGLC